MRTTVKVRKG